MNTRNMLLKFGRRNFCSGTPYHHDYLPPQNLTKGVLGIALSSFDLARIFVYLWIGMKLINHSPSFIAFRKNKFLNNPDYRLCDPSTYEQIKAEHSVKMK